MLFIVTSPHLTFLNIGCNLYTAWQTITIYQISNTKIDVKKSKAVQVQPRRDPSVVREHVDQVIQPDI